MGVQLSARRRMSYQEAVEMVEAEAPHAELGQMEEEGERLAVKPLARDL